MDPHWARMLEIGFCYSVAKSCPTLVTPWTVARQAPLSVRFSRQEHWSGLPFPSQVLILLVHFSRSVVSDSLRLHEPQYTRPSLPITNSRSSLKLMSIESVMDIHPTISSSIIPFSICPQSFPASGTFPMSRLFTTDDQNTGDQASVLPMNIQGLSPLRLTCLIFLCSRDFQESSPEPQFEGINSLVFCPSLRSSSHNYT